MKNRAAQVRLDELKSLGGLVCAIGVLAVLIVLGQLYKEGCLRSGKDYEKCWADGLAISGMSPGGPLSAGVVFGYVVGQINKEKEKREMYRLGYWTLNPDLRPPTSDDPNPPQLR